MPRVHTLKAAKDYPSHGIAKGDTYYKWSLKRQYGGVTFKSKKYPRQSQLTENAFYQPLYQLLEGLEDIDVLSADDLETFGSDIQALGEEQNEKFENMPEGFQQGSTGETLSQRASDCEQWASDIETKVQELNDKLEELNEDAEAAHKAAVDAWAAYDEERDEWDSGEARNPDDEPTEPEMDRPDDEDRDFEAERQEAIQEAYDEIINGNPF